MKSLVYLVFLSVLIPFCLEAQQCCREKFIRQAPKEDGKSAMTGGFHEFLYVIDPLEYETILYGDDIDKINEDMAKVSADPKKTAKLQKKRDEISEKTQKDLTRHYEYITKTLNNYGSSPSGDSYKVVKRTLEDHLDFAKAFEDKVVNFIEKDLKNMENELKKGKNLDEKQIETLKADIESATIQLAARKEKAKKIYETRTLVDEEITKLVRKVKKDSRNKN